MKEIGFIDCYLDEWHANNYPQWIADRSKGEFKVAYCYGDITAPRTGMTSEQWAQKYGVELCGSIEELIEKSDCLIVLSPDNPEQHGRLCKLEATGNFWDGFIDSLLEFFRTSIIPVPHEETVSIAAIRAAAIESAKTPFVWVDVK